MGSIILWCVQGPQLKMQLRSYEVITVHHCCLFSQTDADPEVCKRMCKANHYENVLSLVSYYQMVRHLNNKVFYFEDTELKTIRVSEKW